MYNHSYIICRCLEKNHNGDYISPVMSTRQSLRDLFLQYIISPWPSWEQVSSSLWCLSGTTALTWCSIKTQIFLTIERSWFQKMSVASATTAVSLYFYFGLAILRVFLHFPSRLWNARFNKSRTEDFVPQLWIYITFQWWQITSPLLTQDEYVYYKVYV